MRVYCVPNAHPFRMSITIPVDINPCSGEKSISLELVRYVIRIIYMYEKNNNK